MKIIEKIVDVLTNEETIIERDETSEETRDRLTTLAEAKAKKIESENRAAEKNALLAKLGITEDEARLLLG